MEIIEAIKSDHDNFGQIVAKIGITTGKDIELRKQLLPQFMRLLYIYYLAKREALF
jgi:hypothetical protein